ncbi:MAG: hypothetical protein ACOYM7_10575 [Paludibacter sp.]
MVLFSPLAENDLSSIFIGLSLWKKHRLEFNHVEKYVDDIVDVCENLDKSVYHANVQYEIHKQFGKKVHCYNRNKSTTWYIIYDIDLASNTIYIQHITSNHVTVCEKE